MNGAVVGVARPTFRWIAGIRRRFKSNSRTWGDVNRTGRDKEVQKGIETRGTPRQVDCESICEFKYRETNFGVKRNPSLTIGAVLKEIIIRREKKISNTAEEKIIWKGEESPLF